MSKSSYPRFQRARDFKKAVRTAGNVTFGTAAFNVDTAMDLTLTAQVGDCIECSVSGLWNITTGSDASLTVVTIVAGSIVNYITGIVLAVGSGVPGWYGPNRNTAAGVSGSALTGSAAPYVVVAGDISSGAVTLRLRGLGGGTGSHVLNATATTPFWFWAKNLGPADPN